MLMCKENYMSLLFDYGTDQPNFSDQEGWDTMEAVMGRKMLKKLLSNLDNLDYSLYSLLDRQQNSFSYRVI